MRAEFRPESLRSNIKSRPEGTKSLEHRCIISFREHYPAPSLVNDAIDIARPSSLRCTSVSHASVPLYL